jgi:hypothetical protein
MGHGLHEPLRWQMSPYPYPPTPAPRAFPGVCLGSVSALHPCLDDNRSKMCCFCVSWLFSAIKEGACSSAYEGAFSHKSAWVHDCAGGEL